MDFFYHCNEFEYIHGFVNFSGKSDDSLLVYQVLDNNVCLYEIEYNISSSIKNLHVAKNIILNLNRVPKFLRLLKRSLGSSTTNNWSIYFRNVSDGF